MDENYDLYDLPASLVEELIDRATESGDAVVKELSELNRSRAKYEQELKDAGLVKREADIFNGQHPTVCGVDGSYSVERLLSVDFAAGVAVAVEGLSSEEKRSWEKPHHTLHVATEQHDDATATIVRAIMLGYELLHAIKAPHDVVMLDQTLTLPVIYFNQAINRAAESPHLRSSKVLFDSLTQFLEAYRSILISSRADKQYVGLPKYSSRRELATRLGWKDLHDDRGILSYILEPGTYVRPLTLEQPPQAWHMNLQRASKYIEAGTAALAKEIESALRELHVSYHRPVPQIPTLRLELSRTVSTNDDRLAVVLTALKEQCVVPSMLEPYPLYMADRIAKAIPRAFPAFRQITARSVAEKHDGPIAQVYFAMHGYRSEAGR